MKQIFSNYTQEDHAVWKTLFDRQFDNLQQLASREYLAALEDMKSVLHGERIPKFEDLNEWFAPRTGWQIHCVPGLIPVNEFFELLAQKKFCSSTWLRTRAQLDYLEEPDMFHDIFGHIPLLSNPVYSDFIHQFGVLGASFKHREDIQIYLQRLYWFTIEFGLIQQDNGTRIYGAGILSSFGESNICMTDAKNQFEFNLDEIIHKPYDTDVIQTDYFIIESLDQLFNAIKQLTIQFKNHELEGIQQ